MPEIGPGAPNPEENVKIGDTYIYSDSNVADPNFRDRVCDVMNYNSDSNEVTLTPKSGEGVFKVTIDELKNLRKISGEEAREFESDYRARLASANKAKSKTKKGGFFGFGKNKEEKNEPQPAQEKKTDTPETVGKKPESLFADKYKIGDKIEGSDWILGERDGNLFIWRFTGGDDEYAVTEKPITEEELRNTEILKDKIETEPEKPAIETPVVPVRVFKIGEKIRSNDEQGVNQEWEVIGRDEEGKLKIRRYMGDQNTPIFEDKELYPEELDDFISTGRIGPDPLLDEFNKTEEAEEPTDETETPGTSERVYRTGEHINLPDDEGVVQEWEVIGRDEEGKLKIRRYMGDQNTPLIQELTVSPDELNTLTSPEKIGPQSAEISEDKLREKYSPGEFFKINEEGAEWQVAGYTEDGKVVLLDPSDPDRDITVTKEELDEWNKPKYKEGDIVKLVNEDGEPEEGTIDKLNPDGTYNLKREGEDGVIDTEEHVPEEMLKAERVDAEAISIQERLIAGEQNHLEELEKRLPLVQKLTRGGNRYFRKHWALRALVGGMTTAMTMVPGFDALNGAGHAAKAVMGSLGGGMLTEAIASGALQRLMNGKLKGVRENGTINTQIIEGLSKDDVLEAYAALREIASEKGLKIDSELFKLDQKHFAEIDREYNQKVEARQNHPLFGKFDKLKASFNKMPLWKKVVVGAGVPVLLGIGVGTGVGVIGGASAASAASWSALGVRSAAVMGMGMLNSQRQIDARAFEQSDMAEALRNDLVRRGMTEADFKRIDTVEKVNRYAKRGAGVAGMVGGAVLSIFFGGHANANEGGGQHINATPGDEHAPSVPAAPEHTVPEGGTHDGIAGPVVPGHEAPMHNGGPESSVPGGTTDRVYHEGPGDRVIPRGHIDINRTEIEEIPSGGSHSGSLSGQEASDGARPYAVLPGEEHPNDVTLDSDRPYAVLPGEEAPAHTPEVIIDNKGSDNLLDEITLADGKENFGQALLRPNGLSNLLKKTVDSIEAKNPNLIPPGMKEEIIEQTLAKQQLEGIMNSDGSINEAVKDNFINNFNGLENTKNIINDINNGIDHVDNLSRMSSIGAEGMINPDAHNITLTQEAIDALSHDGNGVRFVEEMTRAVHPEMTDAQIDDLADRIADRLVNDGILNGNGGVEDFDRLKEIDPFNITGVDQSGHMDSGTLTEAANNATGPSVEGSSTGTEATNTAETAAQASTIDTTKDDNLSSQPIGQSTGTNFFGQPFESHTPVQPVEIPGITDAIADPNKFYFDAATPLSESQLQEILNPDNGYLSKEVGETYQRLLREGLLRKDDFRWANVPDGQDQIKIDTSHMPEAAAPGHADYIGHQLLRDYNIAGNEQHRGFFERILGGFRRPEAAPTPGGNVANGITPEPQSSTATMTTPVSPGDGGATSGAPLEQAPDMGAVTTPSETVTPGSGTIITGGNEIKAEDLNNQN